MAGSATNEPLEKPIGMLIAIAEKVQREAVLGKKTKWDNTPLKIMKLVSNSVVGKSGELFKKRLFEDCGYNVSQHTVRGEYDLLVEGIKIEVKTATMDTSGAFQFNGIRHDRDYDILSVLGIAPREIYFRFYKKIDLPNEKMVLIAKNILGNYKMTKRPNTIWHIASFCDKAGNILNAD